MTLGVSGAPFKSRFLKQFYILSIEKGKRLKFDHPAITYLKILLAEKERLEEQEITKANKLDNLKSSNTSIKFFSNKIVTVFVQ